MPNERPPISLEVRVRLVADAAYNMDMMKRENRREILAARILELVREETQQSDGAR